MIYVVIATMVGIFWAGMASGCVVLFGWPGWVIPVVFGVSWLASMYGMILCACAGGAGRRKVKDER